MDKFNKKYNLKEADDHKGKLIDTINDYEIWFIGSHESAKQIGRFYKGISAKWSTSVDSDYFWNNNYKNDTFYFLIRKNPVGNEFDKLAFQFRKHDLQIWDLNNRKGTFEDEEVISYMKDHYHWIDKISDEIRYFYTPDIKILHNEDGTVNIVGSIYLDSQNLYEFPWIEKFKINELFGSLYINDNNFTSLIGCPKVIHGDFNCENNPIVDDYFPVVEGLTFK